MLPISPGSIMWPVVRREAIDRAGETQRHLAASPFAKQPMLRCIGSVIHLSMALGMAGALRDLEALWGRAGAGPA